MPGTGCEWNQRQEQKRGQGQGLRQRQGWGWHLPDLGPGGADVLHVLDAADTVVGDLAAGQADVVPKPTLPIRAEPADGACGDRGAAVGGCCATARTRSLVPAHARAPIPTRHAARGRGQGHARGCSGTRPRRATVTFKAVAEDLLEDGGKVDELLGGVVDGLRRVFLQQGLHREPGGGRGQGSQVEGDGHPARVNFWQRSKTLLQMSAFEPGSGKRAAG